MILYSQGYRFDWNLKELKKTGGLYLKATPPRTDVYINDSFAKRTDFLFDSVFLTNLLPKSYHVRVEKKGYIPWTKTLLVEPKQVTEAKHIILFPEAVRFQTTSQDILRFWPSPDTNKVLLQKTFPEDNSWNLILSNRAQSEERVLLEGAFSEDVTKVEWSEDSARILVQTVSDKGSTIRIWDIERNERTPCSLVPCVVKDAIEAVSFTRQSPNHVIGLKTINSIQTLGTINYIEGGQFAARAQHILSFTSTNRNAIYLDEQGVLWQKDLFSNDQATSLNTIPYSVKKETQYELTAVNNTIFLQEEQDKLLYLNLKKEFEVLSQHVKVLMPSPDQKKIAYANDFGISIFYLEPKTEDSLQKNAGTGTIAWLENDHLFFTAGNMVKVSEIDIRDHINEVDFGEFRKPNIFWNRETKTLHILSEGLVQTSEKLLP